MAGQAVYQLPQPTLGGEFALVEALRQRRSVRAFDAAPLTLAEVGQLLWGAQGVTSAQGYRTAPSAGALYPLILYLLAGRVDGLPIGSYRYEPASHRLTATDAGDLRDAVASAALGQRWIAQAPAIVVICAIEARTTRKYGRRGVRYVHMEAGHAGQNLLLQAVALGLGGTVVGAFDDELLSELLALPDGERPLAVLPVGRPD